MERPHPRLRSCGRTSGPGIFQPAGISSTMKLASHLRVRVTLLRWLEKNGEVLTTGNGARPSYLRSWATQRAACGAGFKDALCRVKRGQHAIPGPLSCKTVGLTLD